MKYIRHLAKIENFKPLFIIAETPRLYSLNLGEVKVRKVTEKIHFEWGIRNLKINEGFVQNGRLPRGLPRGKEQTVRIPPMRFLLHSSFWFTTTRAYLFILFANLCHFRFENFNILQGFLCHWVEKFLNSSTIFYAVGYLFPSFYTCVMYRRDEGRTKNNRIL